VQGTSISDPDLVYQPTSATFPRGGVSLDARRAVGVESDIVDRQKATDIVHA